MKIAIIIVSYNRDDLLKPCLASLSKSTYQNYEVIVVDNGATDTTGVIAKDHFPEVTFIKMGYNSGFCRANNYGIQKALDHRCDAVILLNNDTEVDHFFIEEMVRTVDRSNKVGMVAAKVVSFRDRRKIDSTGLMITPDGLGKNRLLGHSIDTAPIPQKVFCPAGSAALYTREVLEDIVQDQQYLDEDYFLYVEELDLGWRARLRGWECRYASKAIVYHHKRAATNQYPERMLYYASRNIYYNILKNYPGYFYPLRAIILSIVRNGALLFGRFFKRGAISKAGVSVKLSSLLYAYVKSLVCLGKNFTRIMKKRSFIQKRRKISRSEVDQWFKELGLSFFDSIFKL